MVLTVFAVFLVLKLVVELYLDWRNLRHVRRHAHEIPESYRGFIDEETYAKSVRYTGAKTRFGMFSNVFEAVILAAVFFTGFLPWLWQWVEGWFGANGETIWAQSLALFVVGFLLSLPSLPLDLYYTFKLEDRFGFNKMTPGLWIADQIKGLIVGLVLMVPLIMALLWIYSQLGDSWWIWAAALTFGFMLVMMIVYPMFILPMFNKFEPLKDEGLKKRLMDLADRTGFSCKTILEMDGSKRSAHSNAYFTGFGKGRRVVLFDTLIKQLEPEELEAVLAHEIGHFKCGHIPKRIVVSGIYVVVMFALLGWFVNSDWFLTGFGFEEGGGLAPALLVFQLAMGLVLFWLTPIQSLPSRKHEYEADAFAKNAVGRSDKLIGSLRKLSEKNLSNLTPDPVYSWFYYSHPTLLEREAALNKVD